MVIGPMSDALYICSVCDLLYTGTTLQGLSQSDVVNDMRMCCNQPVSQIINLLGYAAKVIQQDSPELQAEVYKPLREFERKIRG